LAVGIITIRRVVKVRLTIWTASGKTIQDLMAVGARDPATAGVTMIHKIVQMLVALGKQGGAQKSVAGTSGTTSPALIQPSTQT
jgi:hypothetical protein